MREGGWKYILKNIICELDTFIGVQHIQYNKQTRAALSNTVTHGNANDIAAKVMAIKQTRKEVEKNL